MLELVAAWQRGTSLAEVFYQIGNNQEYGRGYHKCCFRVHGRPPLNGFEYDPKGDHRMAMAACILAIKTASPCLIRGADCVQVSFPTFFEYLQKFLMI